MNIPIQLLKLSNQGLERFNKYFYFFFRIFFVCIFFESKNYNPIIMHIELENSYCSLMWWLTWKCMLIIYWLILYSVSLSARRKSTNWKMIQHFLVFLYFQKMKKRMGNVKIHLIPRLSQVYIVNFVNSLKATRIHSWYPIILCA